MGKEFFKELIWLV